MLLKVGGHKFEEGEKRTTQFSEVQVLDWLGAI